ncbi:MAG: ATP synthase subunit I [Pseudomonadales bacterium]|nr:ATP synthase subunit I [Pseudomonadales bacterium]
MTFLLATALLVQSQAAALSYVSGGLTIALPSAFMAWRTGRRVARPAAALVILINAEIGKLLLTALMMGAVFVWVEALQPGWYFTALVVGMMCNIMVPLLWRGRRDTGYDRPTQDSAQE